MVQENFDLFPKISIIPSCYSCFDSNITQNIVTIQTIHNKLKLELEPNSTADLNYIIIFHISTSFLAKGSKSCHLISLKSLACVEKRKENISSVDIFNISSKIKPAFWMKNLDHLGFFFTHKSTLNNFS